MEKKYAEQMLQLVTEDLKGVHEEMKELDRLYINKQKQVRSLKKAKAELEEYVKAPSVSGFSGWNDPKNFNKNPGPKLSSGFVYCD